MDLQWQRQTELWLRLMEIRGVAAAQRLELHRGNETLYLEPHAGRARLALSRPLSTELRQPTLLRLLSLLQPEAGGGIPLRAWLAQGQIWLAATAPEGSGAELWAQLAHQQRRLLDRVTENAHENAQ